MFTFSILKTLTIRRAHSSLLGAVSLFYCLIHMAQPKTNNFQSSSTAEKYLHKKIVGIKGSHGSICCSCSTVLARITQLLSSQGGNKVCYFKIQDQLHLSVSSVIKRHWMAPAILQPCFSFTARTRNNCSTELDSKMHKVSSCQSYQVRYRIF